MTTHNTDDEQEKQSEIKIPSDFPENEMLIDLAVGDFFDGVITVTTEAKGRMKSCMFHGFTLPEKMEIKMWGNTFLEGAFSRKPELFGMPIRIRRIEDSDTGAGNKMKMYRISDLKQLLANIKKDKV